ncbi:MAG TPA: tetratricopeptide repeat protein, partial [Phycisphaerales bacterium]|nr:tetratricopeptide repeat protein [Phycisphaerales bacterium]
GEEGVRADPADGKLHAEVRNMSAQATMTKGGFDQAGESGGFRANIRDAEKQRRLDEEERMVRGELTADRVVADARAAYQARPDDRPSITRYAKALLDRGTPADEQTAREVLLRAYEQTQEFRFRQMAGDIGLRQAKRQLAALEKQGAEAARIEQARRALAELEAREYQARVAAYPTDLGLKLELGRRLLALDRHEEAIAVLQEAKADVKNRPKVLGHLGTAFEAIGWTDEAIETYRLALDPAHAPVGGVDETTAMELRYGLMRALEARANESGDLASADEAYKLASSIAMEQISYKDVRARREALKQLAARLREAGGAATR